MTDEARQVQPLHMTPVPSAFGEFSIVWSETPAGPGVRRILLPGERVPAEELGSTAGVALRLPSETAVDALAQELQSYLEGGAVDFRLDLLDLGQCSEFQKRVLLAEYQIPRGWVSTYGRIARSLGVPGAARAVGTALARNPFPIIIPCHRAIRANGDLGGFRGGLEMKRALLEMEGVEFAPTGKVISGRFYY